MKNIQTFEKDKRSVYNKYKNAEIQDSEKYVHEFISVVSEYKKLCAEGIRYDWLPGLSYARLYLINIKKNELEKAGKYYKKSCEYLMQDSGRTEEQVKNEKPKILEFIKNMDIKNDVKWFKLHNKRVEQTGSKPVEISEQSARSDPP